MFRRTFVKIIAGVGSLLFGNKSRAKTEDELDDELLERIYQQETDFPEFEIISYHKPSPEVIYNHWKAGKCINDIRKDILNKGEVIYSANPEGDPKGKSERLLKKPERNQEDIQVDNNINHSDIPTGTTDWYKIRKP